jgi:hypothetical protein
MNSPINSFDDLFDRWDRQSHLAADIGVSAQHLRMMRVRGSIPVRFWPRLLAGAQRRGIQGFNYEVLVRLHVPKNLRCPDASSPKLSLSFRSPS